MWFFSACKSTENIKKFAFKVYPVFLRSGMAQLVQDILLHFVTRSIKWSLNTTSIHSKLFVFYAPFDHKSSIRLVFFLKEIFGSNKKKWFYSCVAFYLQNQYESLFSSMFDYVQRYVNPATLMRRNENPTHQPTSNGQDQPSMENRVLQRL